MLSAFIPTVIIQFDKPEPWYRKVLHAIMVRYESYPLSKRQWNHYYEALQKQFPELTKGECGQLIAHSRGAIRRHKNLTLDLARHFIALYDRNKQELDIYHWTHFETRSDLKSKSNLNHDLSVLACILGGLALIASVLF